MGRVLSIRVFVLQLPGNLVRSTINMGDSYSGVLANKGSG